MNAETELTPTPYVVNGFGGDYHVVARMQPHGVAISALAALGGEIETARFIVLACNSFATLSAHNRELVAALEQVVRTCRCSGTGKVISWDMDGGPPLERCAACANSRAALKSVKP